MGDEPERAGGQQAAAEPLRPRARALTAGLEADVEGGLAQARVGDAACRIRAVGRTPALPQPIGNVETRAVLGGQQSRPALGDAPQDGVDQLDEAIGAAIAPRDLHGQIDDGVGRHAEAQELGGPGKQNRPQAALVRRQRPLQEGRQHMLQLTLPAQHGGRHRPGERAVPRLHGGDLRAGGAFRQHLLQGLLVDEHAGDEMHRERARRQALAGHLRCSTSAGSPALAAFSTGSGSAGLAHAVGERQPIVKPRADRRLVRTDRKWLSASVVNNCPMLRQSIYRGVEAFRSRKPASSDSLRGRETCFCLPCELKSEFSAYATGLLLSYYST